MPIVGLNHVGLSTPDLDRLQRFYCDGLGMAAIGGFSWEPGNTAADAGLGVTDSAADVLLINAGNVFLEAFQWRNPVGRIRSGASFGPLTWEVVDADAVRAIASAAGCPIHSDGTFLDPAGVRTRLLESDSPLPDDGGSRLVHRLVGVAMTAVDPFEVSGWWRDVTDITVEPVDALSRAGSGEPDRICDLGANHLCVDVVDIDASHAELTARGMTSHVPPVRMPGGHAAVGYGWDPFGNALELLESYDEAAALSRHRLTRA